MTLVDTSAWIEFLRGTGHPAHLSLRGMLHDTPGEIATTEPVIMEVLAGARPGRDLRDLRERMLGYRLISVHGIEDFERGAAIFRRCRTGGGTVRSMIDCLIAAVAIRSGAPLLHADADFELIARHTDLAIAPLVHGGHPR